MNEKELDKLAKKEFGCYIIDEYGNYIYLENHELLWEDAQLVNAYKIGYRQAIEDSQTKPHNN